MHRIVVTLALAGAACRPDPAPLQPSKAAPPAETAPPADSVPAAESVKPAQDAAPSTDVLCEKFAAAYCEPGDESPAAIRPQMREFVVLDCKKRLLACEQSNAAVQRCIESTKACGDMQKCLPQAQDCSVGPS